MLCLQHKDCLVLVPHLKVGSKTAKGEQVQSEGGNSFYVRNGQVASTVKSRVTWRRAIIAFYNTGNRELKR